MFSSVETEKYEIDTIRGSYTYEIVISISANLTSLAEEVERELHANIVDYTKSPRNARRILVDSLHMQLNVETSRQGVSLQNDTNLMIADRFKLGCTKLNVAHESVSKCFTVTAPLVLRSTEQADIALETIKDSMGNIDRKEDGLLNILFLFGKIDDIVHDDSLITPALVEKELAVSETSKLSVAGSITITLGSIILILVSALVIWHKRKSNMQGGQHSFLDDDSLASKSQSKIGDYTHLEASDKGTDSLSENASQVE